MFTSIDHEKFRALRIAHLATRFEELITDEVNDELTPEQVSSLPLMTPWTSAVPIWSRN